MGARHQRAVRLRRLLQRRSVRDAERAFVVEGAKGVAAAFAAGAAVEAIYVDSGAELSCECIEVIERAATSGVRRFELGSGVMQKVADTTTPQAISAVVGFVDRPLESLEQGSIVVLVDVRDPGNVGSIVRSGGAAGIDALVICEGCCDLYNPKTIRATAGSIFQLPIVRAPTAGETLAFLLERGFEIVGTRARGGEDYSAAVLERPFALFFGNEASGLSDDVLHACTRSITVPLGGEVESLNVAMAMTVVVFELARRRRQSEPRALSMGT